MELICPSCEARYRVPEGAIGPRGRQVSCANCGHAWRAEPPLVLDAQARSAEPAMAASGPGAPGQHAQPGRPERQPHHVATAEIHSLRPSEPSRVAQLAEIRDMIAQVQSDERPQPAEGHATRHAVDTEIGRVPNVYDGVAPATAAPAARSRSDLRRVDDVDERGDQLHQDPLRRRMAEHDARAARERNERERLRRSMKYRKQEKRAGSGAFLAGFLLVVLVFAALLAAYLLHAEIAVRVPESAPILARYVESVNDLRASIAEGYEQARAWVMETVGDMT